MTKEDKLEKALYSWTNEVEKFETAVYEVIDEKKPKRELNRIASEVKKKFRYLEDRLKFY